MRNKIQTNTWTFFVSGIIAVTLILTAWGYSMGHFGWRDTIPALCSLIAYVGVENLTCFHQRLPWRPWILKQSFSLVASSTVLALVYWWINGHPIWLHWFDY